MLRHIVNDERTFSINDAPLVAQGPLLTKGICVYSGDDTLREEVEKIEGVFRNPERYVGILRKLAQLPRYLQATEALPATDEEGHSDE